MVFTEKQEIGASKRDTTLYLGAGWKSGSDVVGLGMGWGGFSVAFLFIYYNLHYPEIDASIHDNKDNHPVQ